MPSRTSPRAQLAAKCTVLLGLVLLSACDTPLAVDTPLPQPGTKPVVTVQRPTSGSSFAIHDPVLVDGIAQDRSGIIRVDLLVNGAVTDSQSLFVASSRFEYSSTWRPTAGGQMTLSLVAYNVNNVASDPASVTVNVSGQTATATIQLVTPSLTPFILYVTATPSPSPRAITPAVTVVTTTPLPTQTRRPTAISVLTVAPTATLTQTATITLTPH